MENASKCVDSLNEYLGPPSVLTIESRMLTKSAHVVQSLVNTSLVGSVLRSMSTTHYSNVGVGIRIMTK